MKFTKVSNLQLINIEQPESLKRYLRDLDDDIKNLSFFTQGRVSFGTGTDGDRGQNMSGEFQQFTSDATPNTEFNVAHTIGSIPIGAIIMHQDKAGHLYQGPTTGTNWTSTQVSFKSDVASVTFNVFLVKKGE